MVASGSTALAVIPTTVPIAAFSSTVLAAPSPSLTGPTGLSFTSATAMVNTVSATEPSALVALTVMLVVAPTTSRSMADATVTTPVAASMAKRLPGLPPGAKL